MDAVGGGVRIQLNVYDVLPDLAKANKVLADYIGAGGAFHSGVVIHYLHSEPKEWVRRKHARARGRAHIHTHANRPLAWAARLLPTLQLASSVRNRMS